MNPARTVRGLSSEHGPSFPRRLAAQCRLLKGSGHQWAKCKCGEVIPSLAPREFLEHLGRGHPLDCSYTDEWLPVGIRQSESDM